MYLFEMEPLDGSTMDVSESKLFVNDLVLNFFRYNHSMDVIQCNFESGSK